MSQVIQVAFGGTGVNIGKACLELSAEEHGIGPDGFFKDEEAALESGINHNVLFREDSMGCWTPRSIFFDIESEAIDSLL